jgi:hypothetical protein
MVSNRAGAASLAGLTQDGLRNMAKKLWKGLSRGARIGSIVGGVALLPCATYSGIALGTLGGGWGWNIAGMFGVWVGIVFTVVAVGGGIVLTGAAVGGVLGAVIGRLFRNA